MGKQNESIKTLNELPSILQVGHIIQAMGLSRPTVYKMMEQRGFPLIRIGKRRLVYKDAFIKWLNAQGPFENKEADE